MVTIESLKEKVMEHLNSIDLTSLGMQDLNTYVFTLNSLNEMGKSDYMEALLKMASSGMILGNAETKGEE